MRDVVHTNENGNFFFHLYLQLHFNFKILEENILEQFLIFFVQQ